MRESDGRAAWQRRAQNASARYQYPLGDGRIEAGPAILPASILQGLRPQHPGLEIEHRSREAMAIGHDLLHNRQRVCTRGLNLADDVAKIEREFSVELECELLHAPILGEAEHMQEAEAAVARREQSPAQQRRTDAVTLPRLLNAERSLPLTRKSNAKRSQLRRATHHSADEEAVHHGVEWNGQNQHNYG